MATLNHQIVSSVPNLDTRNPPIHARFHPLTVIPTSLLSSFILTRMMSGGSFIYWTGLFFEETVDRFCLPAVGKIH